MWSAHKLVKKKSEHLDSSKDWHAFGMFYKNSIILVYDPSLEPDKSTSDPSQKCRLRDLPYLSMARSVIKALEKKHCRVKGI